MKMMDEKKMGKMGMAEHLMTMKKKGKLKGKKQKPY